MPIKDWSPEVRKSVQQLQKNKYRHLGKKMGLGNDPEKAYAHFVRPRIPEEKLSPEELFKYLGSLSEEEKVEAEKSINAFKKTYWEIGLPTPYEDPTVYPMLLEMADTIERAAQESPSLTIPFSPMLCTLPSGQVNAKVSPLKGEYLIIFEQGLFPFIHQMSQIAAKAILTLALGNDRELHELVDQFGSVLYAYVIEGNPRQISKYGLKDRHKPTAIFLLRSCELFVLAHEYGHIILGHQGSAKRIVANFVSEPAEQIAWDWQQEYAADELGIKIISRIMSPWGDRGAMGLYRSYWGADFFFTSCEILEQCLSVLQTGSVKNVYEGSSEHPPISDRRERFRRYLLDTAHDKEDAQRAAKMGKELQMAMDILWKNVFPAFLGLYLEQKIKPSSIWLEPT